MRQMSGLAPKEEAPAVTSNFISQPAELSHSAQSASEIAVQHTLDLLNGKKDAPMILSGPSPQAAPVPAQPIKKAQLEPPKERELTEKEKREQEEAAMEAMNSIEDRQNNAVKKSLIAQGKEVPQDQKKKEDNVVEEPFDEPKRNAIQEALDKTA